MSVPGYFTMSQLLFGGVCAGAAPNLPTDEMDALHDLYLATDGGNWDCGYEHGNPWVFSEGANPCEDGWIGIQCSSDNASDFSHVSVLSLEDCSLVGTIPESVAALTFMTAFALGGNRLHGTIPDVFGEVTNLWTISLHGNYLSGSLPPSLALLSNINYIILFNNKLSGHVDSAFDPVVQTKLTTVDLSGNSFSGQLPDVLFQNPVIWDLEISTNCFSGTLPNTVCSAVGVTTMDLTCLSCGCSRAYPLVKRSYFLLDNPVHGTVPACVFDMPNLSSIFLSYNYLTGTLPALVTISQPNLLVVLNGNGLTGPVPQVSVSSANGSFSLNLVNNRVEGAVPRPTVTSWSGRYEADVTYNRISGPAFGADWPRDAVVVALTGNILGCNNGDRSRLPPYDPAYYRYTCGSDNFNKPVIAWLCTAASVAILGYCVWYWRGRLDVYLGLTAFMEHLALWRTVVTGKHMSVGLPSLVHIRDVALMLVRVAVAAAVGALFVLAPLYAGLTAKFGTYTHQYAWTLSSVLLSGKVSFAVCFAAFLLVNGLSVWALFWGHGHLAVPAPGASIDPSRHAIRPRIIAASSLYLIINFGVVGLVSFSFVATSIYTSAVYQLGISAFKVGWNLFVAPYLSRWLAYELSAARADWFTLELFVSIMNNIGIPLLAVIIVSPQCLYNLVGIELTYAVGLGELASGADYDQPFYYSYQCSYIYMDFYAAAFVYASLMASFGMPLLEQLLLQVHRRCARGTVLFRCVDAVLPRILKPVETDPERIPDRSVLRPFFDTTQFLVAQLTSLALILTMGVVFPPLALPVAVTMVVSGYIETLKVGRLLTNASEQAQHKYLDIIEQECANVATPTTMRRAFWLLLWFGCWFYTLFLFDTLGDAVGFYPAYWVLIVVPLLPLVAVVVYLVHEYWCVARTLAAYIAHRLWPHAHTVRDAHKDGSVTSVQASGVEVEMVQSPVWAP
jgi:hypothetical protein